MARLTRWMAVVPGLKSGVARWDIRFTNRKPISTASSSIWPGPSRFGHRHRDRWGPMKTALLHWEDAVLISERLVTNDSGFPCLSAIVYTCPSKWSTLPSSWVTRSLSVSLTTAAADSTPLLSSCTWYNKKRISRNRKVFTQNSALIPPKAK